MTETPGERFRRIVTEWRQQKQRKPRPTTALKPDKPSRAVRTAAPETGKRAQTPSQTSQPENQPVTQLTPRTAQPPGQPSQSAYQPTPSPTLRSAQPPNQSPPNEAPGSALSAVDQPTTRRSGLLGLLSSQGTQLETTPPPHTVATPLEPMSGLEDFQTPADARQFLDRLRVKTARIVQDFTEGLINQHQFQALYAHYQRQRIAVEQALIEMPGSGAWRAAAVEGHTSFIRQQHASQVLGYAIYEMTTGVRVTHVGDFGLDDMLLVPMLMRSRSNIQGQADAGVKRVELKGGRWICSVSGHYSSLIVIFSAEPAVVQLRLIEDLHRDFETVNETTFSDGDISQVADTFTRLWAFGQGPLEP